MTLGATNREMRDLTQRVVALEGKEKAAYRRLIWWCFAAGLVGGSTVMFAYMHL